MELSLQQRIEARLARHKQMQQSIQHQSALNASVLGQSALPTPLKYSDQVLQQMSQAPSAINPTISNLNQQLYQSNENCQTAARDLAATRTKLLSVERQAAAYETQLREKDQALRRTLGEAASERSGLVESLSQARAQVDAMKVELERKEDIVTRQNVRLQKLTQDY